MKTETLAERTKRVLDKTASIDAREQAIIDRHTSTAPSDGLASRTAKAMAQLEIESRRQQRSYAEQAPPETVEPVKEMLSNIGDRAAMLAAVRKLTPEQRAEALKLKPGVAQIMGDDRGGAGNRTLGAVSRGISSVSQPIQELVSGIAEQPIVKSLGGLVAGRAISQPATEMLGNVSGTAEEIEFIRQFEAASQEFAPARPDDPWYARGPLQATEMAPWMVTVAGGAGIGRAAATGVAGRIAASGAAGGKIAGAVTKAGQAVGKLPTKIPVVGKHLPAMTAGKAGELAGVTTAAYPSLYAQEVDQLKAIGMVDDTRLRLLAGGTAVVSGLIEGIVPNPYGGKVALTEGATKAARQYLWEAAKRAPAEMSEEYLQGVTSGLGEHVAQYLGSEVEIEFDKGSPVKSNPAEKKSIADAFRKGWEQTKEAALPMAFLLGVPAVGGAGRAALQARRTTQLPVGTPPTEQAPPTDVNTRGEQPLAVQAVMQSFIDGAMQKLATLDKPPGAHKWAEIVLGDRTRYKEAPDEQTRNNLWQQSRGIPRDPASQPGATPTPTLPPTLPQGDPSASQVPTNEGTTDNGASFPSEYDSLFNSAGNPLGWRFTRTFAEANGLGPLGVSELQKSVMNGSPITIEQAKALEEASVSQQRADHEAWKEQQNKENEEAKSNPGQKETRTRKNYLVRTEDDGEVDAFILRSSDGSAAIFFGDWQPIDYSAAYAKDKSDEELLSHSLELRGYQGAKQQPQGATDVSQVPTNEEEVQGQARIQGEQETRVQGSEQQATQENAGTEVPVESKKGSQRGVMAVMTSDGKVYSDPGSTMHSDVVEKFGLDSYDIIDGGFIIDGKYKMAMSDGGYAATEGEDEQVATVKRYADEYNAKVTPATSTAPQTEATTAPTKKPVDPVSELDQAEDELAGLLGDEETPASSKPTEQPTQAAKPSESPFSTPEWKAKRAKDITDRKRRYGEKVSDEDVKKQVDQEVELLTTYPPGTKLKIGTLHGENTVLSDGRLFNSTGRLYEGNAGTVLRSYKPSEIQVILEPAKPSTEEVGTKPTTEPAKSPELKPPAKLGRKGATKKPSPEPTGEQDTGTSRGQSGEQVGNKPETTQASADQVNVDSGEESKVKTEDELASLRAKSEKMYDEVERLQNNGKDREANALLREAEKLTPRIKELESPLIKAKQADAAAKEEERRKEYNAKEDARKAALPTKQTRNGWELATDGARWFLRDPNTKEIIYEGSMKRVREVADESKPDAPSVKPEAIPDKPSETVAQLPWSNSSPEDESKWYGTKVSVAPANRREDAYTGQVVRVLNGGDMVEVQPDGQDGTFRVDSARITLTEAAPPTVVDEPSVEPAAEPLPEPAIPAFNRTTPDKGSTTRTFQSERVEKARADIAELEKKARAKRSEHDGLRSNATKKRAAVRKEIESFNRMIQKAQGEIASDMAADTLAKLEDELESPRSYDHYLAGMKAIHKLKAGVTEDAARRGEMGREAARAVVSKEEKEADKLDGELQSRAKDIAMSKGFTSGDADQIALSASNGFTIFEDRSLADVVEVHGKRTRESRVSQEINKLKPESSYGRKQDLSAEQIEEFTKKYQEASKDDKNWLAKRLVVDTAVKDAIDESREAVRKREDEERKEKEAEKAKNEQEALENARERAKKYFLGERISKALKKQKPKTKPVMVRVEEGTGKRKIVEGKITEADQNGELYPNGLILHKSFDEDSGNDFAITHAGSGLGFPFIAKKSAMQELIGLIDLLGLDFNVATDEKGALPSELTSRMKKINTAWDNGDYSTLSEQDYATVEALGQVAKTDIDADLILTADDLGANGIPPGLESVFTDRGLRVVKGMAAEVPEFAYDPVFTVKDGMLLYRDGYEFNIDPTAFNLHPSELKEGQTVGINLEDFGIKRATPQDVVAQVMKGTGIPRVMKGKGGDVSVGYVGSIPASLQQSGEDNEWVVVSGTPKVREMAIAALKKIRWRQPGQDGDPKTDIEVVPVETKATEVEKKSESDIVTPLAPVKRIENVIEQGRATGREPSKAMLEKLADAKVETDSPMDSLPENGYIEGPKGGKLSKPQFEVGERVQVGNSQGIVESVNLRWSGTGPKGSAYKDSYKVRFDSGDLANAGSLSMDGNNMKKATSVEPVTEAPKPISSEAEFMEMSVGVNAPGVKQTIRVTAGERTLLMERSKHDSEWSIKEAEKYTGEVKGKTPVKTKGAVLASGIVETKKAKEIAQRIIDGTFDKDSDKRFVRDDTQNIGLTNAGIAESMKGALGGKRDSFAKLLREQGLVTDGRILMKVNDKDRDAILKGVGETFEGRSLGVVAQMLTDGQKALSRSANAMKPIGYRGGYLTPRTVVLQSQDGDSAIIDKVLHDTILKKYPNAVPYFLEDGKPISYAVDGDLVAIVMPMSMDKPDAKVKDLVAGRYDFEAEAAEAAKFPPPQPKTKLKKAAEKANKELSSAVDEFGNAIKGKLGMNLPLNPEVMAAAAKVVAKALKAGTLNFAELMERMVTKYGEKMAERMRGALQQAWDQQVNSNPVAEDGIPPASPQPHPELVQPEPIPLTSVKNAIVDELRIQRGEDPMPEVTPQTIQQWLEAAGNRIANDPYAGNTLVEQLLTGGKASVDEMEGMVLQYHYRAVNNLFEAADAKLTQAKANGDPAEIAIAQDEARVIMRRLTAVETALDKAGTAWGRAGVSRQIFLKQDFSLASMVRRARVANGGNELSDAQLAIISEQAKRIEELQKQLAEVEAKLEARTSEQEQAKAIDEAIQKDIEEVKPVAKPKSTMRLKAEARVASAWEKFGAIAKGRLYANPIDPELLKPALEVVKAYIDLGMVTFREFMSTAVQNMGAKEAKASEPTFRAAWDQLQEEVETAQPELDLANLGQLTRFAKQVQRTMVESGITEREAVVDAVHEALQEIIPEITRRQTMDALSSYGQFAQLSKDPIDQIIRDINGQLQQLAKLEDMEKGRAPAKTGVERRSPTDEERRLTQLVNEAKRRGGFVVTDPETQLKSAMGAAKTAVKNRIADMNYEIKTGSRVVRNKTELIPDAELEQLRKDRDELQKVHKEMFPPKGATEAQKVAAASRALDAAIANLEAKLAVGDISPAPQPKPLSTPEIDAKRARLKELHQQRDALRKIANPNMTAEQIKVRALDKSIAELEKQLATGDFTPKPKPTPLTSPEIDARQARLEELRATKKAILAAANPKMTPEQRASRAYEAHLRKQLAMYLEKIAQGDFAPKPKKQPRVLTKGELDLKKQLADVKHDFFEALSKYHLANLSPVERAIDIARESAHLSRAIMTSIDLSAILRQGGLGVYSHPAMARKATAEMWHAIWSREKEFQSMEKLQTRPNGQLYEESGLNITDSEGKLTRQEEAFMGRWARTGVDFAGAKVQAATKLALEPVAASARAYVTFINNLRADLFDVMVENLGQGGQVTKEEARLIATYVNAATGRADLKSLNEKAAALNTVFFAPRYVASRFQYLALPLYLLGSKDSGRVKKLIAKEYARTFAGTMVFIGSLTALAYLAAGGDDEEKPSVEFNPLSSDFGKVRIDETRLDPLAGLAQVIVFSSRMLSFHTKSSETGKIKPFYAGGPYETTHVSEAARFLRTKLAPVPGAAVTAMSGMKDVVGQDVTPAGLVAGLFVPISVGEIYSTMRHRGIPKGTALDVLNIMGASVNTYGPKTAYLDATPEQRAKQVKDYIKYMNWESELPAFSQYLQPEDLKRVQDRQDQRRGDLVFEAMDIVMPKKDYKTEVHYEEAVERHEKVIGEFEDFRKQYAPTYADAVRYLAHHYDDEGGVKIKGKRENKPGFLERQKMLSAYYQSIASE